MKWIAWLALGIATPLEAQDGARYPVLGGPVVHVLTKSAASALVYQGLGRLHISRSASLALATVGVFAVAKGLELAKGHRLGPVDTMHDLLAHSLFVVPLATRKGWPGLGIGLLMVGSCRYSAPRWC